ncbi:uncharacterized protein LOC125651336 [Ostrea edulis]|uniref:uncharacterized protein LOC125651336 n=1 Tax=Ostrea edulis TaxID=37623 RepID=UPI0024AED371|nr:uncharacterized protein LOC125651336 [Ostrea edulis]
MLTIVAVVTANGSLFVGLLGFSNPTNRTFNGTCCGGENPDYCSSDCRLLFDVTVVGLDEKQTKTPLETTILGSKVITIPSSYEMKNPLSFSFRKWPGEVDILVSIYDMNRENRNLVDKFRFTFQYAKPDLNYRNDTEFGIRSQNKTALRLILRYNCDKYYFEEDDCSKLCSPGNTPCPIRPTGTPQSITDWILLLTTEKPSTGRICPTTNTNPAIVKTLNSNETTVNCTYENSTSTTAGSAYSTDNAMVSSDTVTSTETVISYTALETTTTMSSSENKETTSPTEDLLLSSLSSHMTSQEPKSTKTITTSTQSTTLKPTTHSSSLKPTIHSPSLKSTTQQRKTSGSKTTKNKLPTNRVAGISTPEPTPSLSTSFPISSTHQTSKEIPGDGKTINDDAMKYWPAIVGGVLGIIAIIAVLGVFIYVRKLRAQQNKTEDIYNVNPQTWILETNENGTSGMSEIALETELV